MTYSLPGNVEKDDCMHLVLLQNGSHVFSVTLQCTVVRQVLPFSLKEVFSTSLPIEHFVAQARIELLWVGLCGKEG